MQNAKFVEKKELKFAIMILSKRCLTESLKKINGLSSCFSDLLSDEIDLCITNVTNSVIIFSV